VSRPDRSRLQDVVAPKVLEALQLSSEALSRAGVRHVVVGGLAVGANGYARATNDVDFLVGGEAFDRHPSGLVTLKAGVPFEVNGVAVDFLSPESGEEFLEEALKAPPGSIAEAPTLVYLKLKSPRSRDRADIIELVKAGIDVEACRLYLRRNAPTFVAAFEEAVSRAEAERD
jgi:hypothetical protein